MEKLIDSVLKLFKVGKKSISYTVIHQNEK